MNNRLFDWSSIQPFHFVEKTATKWLLVRYRNIMAKTLVIASLKTGSPCKLCPVKLEKSLSRT